MPETPKEQLQRRLADYPKEATSFFNTGIVSAAKLTEDKRKLVLAEVHQGLSTWDSPY